MTPEARVAALAAVLCEACEDFSDADLENITISQCGACRGTRRKYPDLTERCPGAPEIVPNDDVVAGHKLGFEWKIVRLHKAGCCDGSETRPVEPMAAAMVVYAGLFREISVTQRNGGCFLASTEQGGPAEAGELHVAILTAACQREGLEVSDA